MPFLYYFQKGFNYSQDGPGNRLVYHLSGCSLRCPWCSNPEGKNREDGKLLNVDRLVEEAKSSVPMFFDGGGVTFTGGEASEQPDALKEALIRLQKEGISTCMETNGASARLQELYPYLDYLIMDYKHWDSKVLREVTGAQLAMVEENLRKAIELRGQVAVRIPLIGGFNTDSPEMFSASLSKLGLPGCSDGTVELLPYHEYGKDKYHKLGIPYPMPESARISEETIKHFTTVLISAGFQVIHT